MFGSDCNFCADVAGWIARPWRRRWLIRRQLVSNAGAAAAMAAANGFDRAIGVRRSDGNLSNRRFRRASVRRSM
jgi:hypothetical protein